MCGCEVECMLEKLSAWLVGALLVGCLVGWVRCWLGACVVFAYLHCNLPPLL